jgi:hypothetical protein
VTDQRDRDDELLARHPAPGQQPYRVQVASPPDDAAFIQRQLDRATGGLVPRWQNDQHFTDHQCAALRSATWDLANPQRCANDETDWVWFGCPHEHINRSGVCAYHADHFEHYKGGWRCQLCYDATGEIILARFIRRERIPDGEGQDGRAASQAPAS